MRKRMGLLFALAVVGLAYPTTRPAGAQIVVKDIASVPVTISISESPDPNPAQITNHGTLTWNGQNYDARFDGVVSAFAKDKKGTATVATITFERDQQNGVTMERKDTAGTLGVTATYTGKIAAGNTISGIVVWSNNGTPFASGKWEGTVTMPSKPAPQPVPQITQPTQTGSPVPAPPTVAAGSGAVAGPTSQRTAPTQDSLPPAKPNYVPSDYQVDENAKVSAAPPLGAPMEIQLCDRETDTHTDCVVLKWAGTQYDGRWDSGFFSNFYVKAYDKKRVLLIRKGEPALMGAIYVYDGGMNQAGIVNGTATSIQAGTQSSQWKFIAAAVPPPPTAAEAAAEKKYATKILDKMAGERDALFAQLKTLPAPASTSSCDPAKPSSTDLNETRRLVQAAHKASDDATAACWAYVGAVKGDAASQKFYAYLLSRLGEGKADLRQAYLWSKLVAEDGGQSAQKDLFQMYRDGKGTPTDSLKSNYWTVIATIDAKTPANQTKSVYCDVENPGHLNAGDVNSAWWESAERGDLRNMMCWEVIGAEVGDPDLQALVGIELMEGIGFSVDEVGAFQLFSSSAATGETAAEYYLSRCYMFPSGTQRDMKKYRYWYDKSQETPIGWSINKDYTDRTYKRMWSAALNFLTSGPTDETNYKEEERKSIAAGIRHGELIRNHYRSF
ncbi:tetratricopeptide repeat protein [Acidicapsa acidisoli]|uniref:tetratricopeptide repeat protein n=1 Tax=Acidicapsa acidisoli TaxID=1615681 RepID=UPI0021DFC3C5|nr:SEL1-like repeat protein [Acidicapsa acidisoli]